MVFYKYNRKYYLQVPLLRNYIESFFHQNQFLLLQFKVPVPLRYSDGQVLIESLLLIRHPSNVHYVLQLLKLALSDFVRI